MLNTSSSISYTLLGFVTDIILFILLWRHGTWILWRWRTVWSDIQGTIFSYNLVDNFLDMVPIFYIPQLLLGLQRGRLSEIEARFYTAEVVEALEYLHGLGLIHCDIRVNEKIYSSSFISVSIS